jgi:hypothetical protein
MPVYPDKLNTEVQGFAHIPGMVRLTGKAMPLMNRSTRQWHALDSSHPDD